MTMGNWWFLTLFSRHIAKCSNREGARVKCEDGAGLAVPYIYSPTYAWSQWENTKTSSYERNPCRQGLGFTDRRRDRDRPTDRRPHVASCYPPRPRPPACEFNWHARPADNSQHRVTELTRAAADLIAFVVCARPQVAKPPPVSVLVAPTSTATVAGRAPWPAAATRSDRVIHGRIHCGIARQPIDRESTQTPCEMYRQSQYSASS